MVVQLECIVKNVGYDGEDALQSVCATQESVWIPAVGSQVPLPSVHGIDQPSVAIAFAVFHTKSEDGHVRDRLAVIKAHRPSSSDDIVFAAEGRIVGVSQRVDGAREKGV
jgi:hypothetical protein